MAMRFLLKTVIAIFVITLVGVFGVAKSIVFGDDPFVVFANLTHKEEINSNLNYQRTLEEEKSFYLRVDNPVFPYLQAGAYLVADVESGDILLSKNMDAKLPIASVSKLVTALTSLEAVSQSQTTTLSASAINTYGTSGHLSVGEQINTGELLYPLLLESSNDAAEAIANHYGRNRFIEQMNNKVKMMGLLDTSFDDPSGLSPFNISTAKDLFKLAKYIYKNKTQIIDIALLDSYVSKQSSLNHTWKKQ